MNTAAPTSVKFKMNETTTSSSAQMAETPIKSSTPAGTNGSTANSSSASLQNSNGGAAAVNIPPSVQEIRLPPLESAKQFEDYLPHVDYDVYKGKNEAQERRKYVEMLCLKKCTSQDDISVQKKCLIVADMLFFALEFGIAQGFSEAQLPHLIDIISSFHKECVNLPITDVSNNMDMIVKKAHEKLQYDILSKAIEYPPDKRRIFTMKETETITNYVYST